MQSGVSSRGVVAQRGDFSSGHFVLRVEGHVGSWKHGQRARERDQGYGQRRIKTAPLETSA